MSEVAGSAAEVVELSGQTQGTTIDYAHIPSVGRIVRYRLTEDDADRINARITDGKRNQDVMRITKPGTVLHIGNPHQHGGIVPMIVVRMWDTSSPWKLNGQAFLDGNHSYWVTSAPMGDGEGQWSWPPRA